METQRNMLDICRRAQAIVEKHPELSFDDVRRILMRLRLTPEQRMERSLIRRKSLPPCRGPGKTC